MSEDWNKLLPSIKWIEVPAGKFIMGGNSFPRERFPHEVHLERFWISKLPVTNIQYQCFLNAKKGHPQNIGQMGKSPWGNEFEQNKCNGLA